MKLDKISQRLSNNDISGISVDGEAGVCMMIHYDIWHRKMKNFTNLKRYMVKFEFIRPRLASSWVKFSTKKPKYLNTPKTNKPEDIAKIKNNFLVFSSLLLCIFNAEK